MNTEEIIVITKEANDRIHKEYPLFKSPVWTYMVEVVIEILRERNELR